MFETAKNFVADKWALLSSSGKTTFVIGVAAGFVAGAFIG